MTDDGPPTSIDQFIPGLYRSSATVSDCRRPTPDTWNLERPACFEIVPTAARSGASRQICTARDHAILRHRACARVAAMTHSRASTGRLCAALDFHPGQSPERSPLHDVRQHARSTEGGGTRNLVYFWTSRRQAPLDPPRQAPRSQCSGKAAEAGDLLSTTSHQSGGARRDRTDDLLLAKQALSQLSYAPVER